MRVRGVSDRYVRQLLLAGWGPEGQARVEQADVRTGGSSFAHDIASRYAKRAGARAIVEAEMELRVDAAEEVTAGARLALRELRRAMDAPG